MKELPKIISTRTLKDNRITCRLDPDSLKRFIELQNLWGTSIQESMRRCIFECFQAYARK